MRCHFFRILSLLLTDIKLRIYNRVVHLISQGTLAQALSLDKDPVARGPCDLIVGDGDPHVALGEDAAGAPGPGDPSTVQVVVGDGHVLLVSRTQDQESVIALRSKLLDMRSFHNFNTNISEDIPVHQEVARHGYKESSHGCVGKFTILNRDL